MAKLAKCDTCGYKGNMGIWKGVYTIGKMKVKFDGQVRLGEGVEEDVWNLDNILPTGAEEWDGMSHCPYCDSTNFD